MHRAYHHHHHEEEEERRDDDGYDEDWDDDVYYAAAARPADSTGSEKATGRDNHTTSGGGGQGEGQGSGGAGGGGARGGGRSGRERVTAKRHYMKVPNMRHLRAMRPTPTPAAAAAAAGDAFPLGGPFHDLLNNSNQGRDISSPRASVSTDPSDTPSASTVSLGDGSGGSVPPLGQLTPPSLPPGADGTELGGVGAGDDGAATQGTMFTSHRTAETPAAVAWPSLGPRDNSNNNNHADFKATVRQREGNESSLVHLRGSPRRRRGGRDDANRPSDRTQLGGKMASSSPPSTAAAAAGRGQQGPRRPITPTSSSSAAVAAGVAAGVAAAYSAGGGKRKRPASATGGEHGKRFGATAWPKLRGGATPPPPARRDPQEGGGGGGGGGGSVREAGGRGTASTSRRPVGGRDGEGGERRRLSGAADCSWHSPSLHTRSPDAASFRPPSRQGHGNDNSKGKGPALRSDGGGGAGVNVGGGGGGTKAAGAATRGPSLRDRPARWAAKSGGSTAWSPLRAPGAPRGGTGKAGNSHSTKNSTSSSGNAVSGKNSPGRSVSSRFSPSRRGAGLPRAGRGGGDAAASSRSRGGEDGDGEEAPTFELTSVFQATPASSSVSPRPRDSGGHTPGGQWRGSQHPMVRARQRAGCSSGGAAAAAGTPPSFDPTRLAARLRPVGETAEELQEVEEVDDVGSDDYGEDDGEGFLNSIACEIADGDSGASQEGRDGDGWREADGGAGGGVFDYEDQLLGEEGGGNAAATRLDVRLQQQQHLQQRLRPPGAAGIAGENPERARAVAPSGGAMDPTGTGRSAEDEPVVEEAGPDSRRFGTLPGETPGAEAGTATEALAVSPAAARRPQRVNDTAAEAAATAAAVRTPRGAERRRHEHQAERQWGRQSEPNKDRGSPPPRTPVRPPRTMFAPSSFGRSAPTPSSAAAAAAATTSASTTGVKWRPSFGSAGGARGGGQSPAAGAMHAPRSAFSTPARDRDRDRDGVAMPPSGSLGTGATGSASARRRKGSGAGNGPLGRLLQQVRARCDGDEARLLSGEFPFRQPSSASKATTSGNKNSHLDDVRVGGGGSGGKSRRDHGDPRTRCSVALDATVILPAATPRGPSVGFEGGLWGGDEGNELGQAGGGGASGLVRFSCFVHHVVDVSLSLGSSRVRPGSRRATSAAGDAAGSSSVATDFGRLHRLEGVRVDGLFKQDTRRAVDVGPGSQLRIYDPCCVWYDAEIGGEGGRAEALLVCTQLCEPYPSCLPALPSPPPPPPIGGGSSSHEGGGGEGSRTTGTAAASALT
ncbi:unnamed protein product [Ectocarpus sp. 4 AP-2014]